MDFERQRDDRARKMDFEARIKTPEQAEKREEQLDVFLKLIHKLPISTDEFCDVMDHASEAYLLLNPLSSSDDENEKQNVVRFKPQQKISPEFQETNWQHTMKMVRIYANLAESFPNVMGKFNTVQAIKMILWHDTPEFLDGDLAITEQNDESRKEKKRREDTAREVIKNSSRLGAEAYEIMGDYEARKIKESRLVKILDILSGINSYYDMLTKYIPDSEEGFAEVVNMPVYKFAEQLVIGEYDQSKKRYNPVIHSLKTDLGYDFDDDSDLELDNFFYCLDLSFHSYNQVHIDLQLSIDKEDFRERMMKCAGFNNPFFNPEKFDIFR